ncbi:MAG: hypothetical protein GY796_32670 [Chloroflexi bacterium]|nr:hypothetical protein [Chloroflexota bacterium]
MAIMTNYLARGTAVGQKQTVKTKKFVWIPVGEGEVVACSNSEIGVKGKIDVVIYRGDLNIHLKLLDENSSASMGKCTLRLNSHQDENAQYQTKGHVLTVTAVLGGKQQNISISPCNGGSQTECKLFGWINETVHLERK